MGVDLDRLTQVLNTSAQKIKEASEVVAQAHDPTQVMQFIPAMMEQFKQLKSIGSLDDIKGSIESAPQTDSIYAAIQTFLQNTKEAQEKVGPMGAALFGTPQFQEFTANLEQVKASLEKKGKRVEGPEEGPGV